MADATIRKRSQNTKPFFPSAMRQKLVSSNPFAGLTSSATGNNERLHFVSRQEVEKVLNACPLNTEWGLIVALCCYGGLRCPSEVLALRWQGVNWEQGWMLVRFPKTEHHPSGESRPCPSSGSYVRAW